MSDANSSLALGQDLREEQVTAELDTVLQSPEFERSPRIREFLRYIVQETIENRAEYLKGYSIALAVFGRDEAFDPSSDPLVRVQGVRLRRMLDQYYLTIGKSNAIRIRLPKGSYVPEFCSLQAEPEDTAPLASGGQRSQEESALAAVPTLAVLPLENLNANADLGYFCDGLSEEIITGLSRFPELAVLSRHTTFQFRGQQFDVRKLRSEIGADFLLEGSIRQADTKIRVTTRLLETSQGTSLWSENYNCALTVENLFDLQANIADQVVAAIAVPYGVIKRSQQSRLKNRGHCSLSAYDWVLRFYQYWRGDIELHGEIREGLEDCIKSDCDLSSVWAALAFLYLDEYRFYHSPQPASEPPLDRAMRVATKAVELNPNCPMSHQALFCAYFHRQEIDEFVIAGERALELNPNHSDMLADLGFDLYCIGERSRGLVLAEKAVRLSPVHPGWYHVTHCVHHYWNQEYRQAMQELKKFNMPQLSGYGVLLAATAARLKLMQVASDAVEMLKNSHPAFVVNPRFELRKWNMDEDLIDSLLEGLALAGLDF